MKISKFILPTSPFFHVPHVCTYIWYIIRQHKSQIKTGFCKFHSFHKACSTYGTLGWGLHPPPFCLPWPWNTFQLCRVEASILKELSGWYKYYKYYGHSLSIVRISLMSMHMLMLYWRCWRWMEDFLKRWFQIWGKIPQASNSSVSSRWRYRIWGRAGFSGKRQQ